MLNRKKKNLALAVAMTMTLSVGTTTFASPLLYDSEEGIGIEVEQSPEVATYSNSIIEGDKVSVAGGKLWATWKGGSQFRANYDHNSKTHRCSVTNDHLTRKRSPWEPKGIRAISPWLDQTFTNNKAYANVK